MTNWIFTDSVYGERIEVKGHTATAMIFYIADNFMANVQDVHLTKDGDVFVGDEQVGTWEKEAA